MTVHVMQPRFTPAPFLLKTERGGQMFALICKALPPKSVAAIAARGLVETAPLSLANLADRINWREPATTIAEFTANARETLADLPLTPDAVDQLIAAANATA